MATYSRLSRSCDKGGHVFVTGIFGCGVDRSQGRSLSVRAVFGVKEETGTLMVLRAYVTRSARIGIG